MKGHIELASSDALKFKEGDGPAFAFHAQTTDKLVLAAENGRFYTFGADKLPGGRGFGEPVRLMIDLEGSVDIIALFAAGRSTRVLLAASDGRGFVARTAELIAETRKGKTVMTPRPGARLHCVRALGDGDDHVAVIGDNRKMLIFPLADVPEMARGQGVQLQRYRDGGLSDVTGLVLANGLSWAMGGESGRTRTEADLLPWRAVRGAAGRPPPVGFPRDNRF